MQKRRPISASRRPSEQASPAELLSRLKDVFEQATKAATGEVPFNLGGKAGRMVFGYTMRMGLDGVQTEMFGDVPPPADAKKAPVSRAPIVDVFEEAETIRVVAELPGVAAEDIVCALDGDTLSIETRGDHRYAKTITLPKPVDASTLSHACRNGILEISIRKAVP